MNKEPAPLLLLILDGWGVAPDSPNNAISQAHTPQWDKWLETGTFTTIDASGETVGLPKSQMGNSEVGHMHIGAGRIIEQDLTRIHHAIESLDFFNNDTLNTAIQKAKKEGAHIHLMGLLSEGGVHAHESHLYALIKLLHQHNIDNALIHAFLDGRDTPPKSAQSSLTKTEAVLKQYPIGHIGSLSGRYYAMDRDNRWERTEKVYEMLTTSQTSTDSPETILSDAYDNGLTDEFVIPRATAHHHPIKEGDLVIFFNFRSDRARQLSYALSQPTFDGFKRNHSIKINLLTMTQYARDIASSVVFPKEKLTNTLGECVEKAHYQQLRIAETEKYAHVTFFFNGGKEAVFEGEDRVLVPSPKVKTYDEKPEMSVIEVTDKLIEALNSQKYKLIICNFANADMVGHTGNIKATIKAIETMDACFSKLDKAIHDQNANLLVTADHGNAEKMFCEENKQTHTAHTSSPVPFLHIGPLPSRVLKTDGSLIDIAPTVLHLLQLAKPSEMTGDTLVTLS